ncbi:hypothetical protein FA15DRAFT_387015 [Coprinopsis marcescibilis]|uniref:Uncharacterized protein n=1 Tax=Coprinopsis marcescibilis TaxID=230819 RepID=A0A5C3KX01_COPMA|nr:hypothetical protein FA15DRAFT_387015 [Coprinopsis marcescibilis]
MSLKHTGHLLSFRHTTPNNPPLAVGILFDAEQRSGWVTSSQANRTIDEPHCQRSPSHPQCSVSPPSENGGMIRRPSLPYTGICVETTRSDLVFC